MTVPLFIFQSLDIFWVQTGNVNPKQSSLVKGRPNCVEVIPPSIVVNDVVSLKNWCVNFEGKKRGGKKGR